jgi:hypothetical protein
MNTAGLRLPKQPVIALTLALVAMLFVVPSAVAGGQHGRHTRVERFLLISTDPDSTDNQSVLGFGPIHAKGVDHVVSDTEDVFQFPAGTLSVTHTPKKSHDFSDPVTCLFTFSERGIYQITGGTGAYAGVSGHGNYRVAATGIGCDQNAAPQVFTVTINAKGPLHLS